MQWGKAEIRSLEEIVIFCSSLLVWCRKANHSCVFFCRPSTSEIQFYPPSFCRHHCPFLHFDKRNMSHWSMQWEKAEDHSLKETVFFHSSVLAECKKVYHDCAFLATCHIRKTILSSEYLRTTQPFIAFWHTRDKPLLRAVRESRDSFFKKDSIFPFS